MYLQVLSRTTLFPFNVISLPVSHLLKKLCRVSLCQLLLLVFIFSSQSASAQAIPKTFSTVEELIEAVVDNWRGEKSSYVEMTMTIHREDWERSMSMRSWSLGRDLSLVRVTEPAKDAGSGTLVNDNDMWSFAPKINRVIKIPSSMMGQSWMGSDFSNRDIARDDDIIEQYTHELIETKEEDGHTVYVVQSIPKEDAAIVWGRQVLFIRDDFALLNEEFYDQDDKLIKNMTFYDIKEVDGYMVSTRYRMQNLEQPDEWTEVTIGSIEFGVDVKESMFTLSNLRNPRQR